MRRLSMLCLVWACAILSLDAAERLWLKDAANGDAVVGPGMHEGIPQGHVLKVALGGVRQKRQEGVFSAVLRDGARELARVDLPLNATGYGEALIPIGLDLPPGVYQIHLGRVGPEADRQTGLGGPFRVVEAAPPVHLPFGAPGLILALGAIALGLCVAWRRQRTA